MLEFLIGAYLIYTIYKITLSLIEINFININSKKQAVVLSETDYKQAAKVAIINQKFSISNTVYSAILLIIWSIWGASFLQNMIAPNGSIFENTLLVVVFLLTSAILQLPFDVYSSFVKDKKLGFSNITWKIFIVDTLKSFIMIVIFGGLVSWLILLCFEWLGNSWWIWAFGLSFAIILLINLIYPTIIAPIFNKVTPLANEELKSAIGSLLTKCGFKSSGVFVIDASKRDKRLNAYFGGFGATKRVVLFDTLIEKLTQNEIIAVLGHELGHFKHKDLLKNIALMFVVLFLLFAIFGNIPNSIYSSLGLNSGGGSFFIFLFLYSPIVSAFFEPIMSAFSRSHEFGADEFGASATTKNDMIQALKKLGNENKAFPISHPVYSFVHHSHPSLYERITKLENS
ncbi:M48 family metallopeptidase [Campylobacter fetus]|uniref:Peptidase, M48 family n=2 Tax=Campylobacter fetus TaxID=196 RepID=A0RNE9_CAMFF|nr:MULTISPECIES: M48 family metallopeptidase [Campylobacter]HDX6330552.1 M48 family metallopeptidase [Campylobacter fetus subsp. venerealis]ABK83248.1 peptidase, M48 family [Campylobacter fetus subsp. fetus 82-40]EAH8300617.1 M48 family peptidase [Campylobacter fetus]EAI3886952.1 M48 family peptidase [Campylobacter fetus]EAI3916380.1 M48 family peptidase [Campylobacter fetus]